MINIAYSTNVLFTSEYSLIEPLIQWLVWILIRLINSRHFVPQNSRSLFTVCIYDFYDLHFNFYPLGIRIAWSSQMIERKTNRKNERTVGDCIQIEKYELTENGISSWILSTGRNREWWSINVNVLSRSTETDTKIKWYLKEYSSLNIRGHGVTTFHCMSTNNNRWGIRFVLFVIWQQ